MDLKGQDARLPLILGVTGHRKIDSKNPKFVDAVRSELLRLRQTYPNTPFSIVSGLAEGADRFVAQLAIETLSARLIAILPFPEAEYRKDFKTAASTNEFSALVKQAQAVLVCPQREEAAAVAASGEARNRQYARAGAYVVENAQILIAVWDGQPARGLGGTGDVVQWRLTGEMPVGFSTSNEERNVLWPKPPERLIHINPVSCEVKYHGAGDLPDPALASMDDYNQELAMFLKEQGNAALEASSQSLLKQRANEPLVQQDVGLQKLLRLFGAADALASRNQARDNTLIFWVAILLFLAMSFSNLTVWKWSMAFYALFLLIIALVDRWAQSKRIEVRFYDYRALAEGLRVAIFWRLAGLPARVSQNYLNQHLGVVSWIREALASGEMAALPSDAAGLPLEGKRVAVVSELWLHGQGGYFQRKVEQLQRRTALLSKYTTTAFFVSWGVAVAKLFTSSGNAQVGATITQFVLLSGPFLAAAVALGFYRNKRAMDGVLRRYTLSRLLYERSAARLNEGNYKPETVLLQIGREALNENADWLWLQRDTPLKPRR